MVFPNYNTSVSRKIWISIFRRFEFLRQKCLLFSCHFSLQREIKKQMSRNLNTWKIIEKILIPIPKAIHILLDISKNSSLKGKDQILRSSLNSKAKCQFHRGGQFEKFTKEPDQKRDLRAKIRLQKQSVNFIEDRRSIWIFRRISRRLKSN